METPTCIASCQDDQALSEKPELPLKKRILDRGKAVSDEAQERENIQTDINMSELPKITLDVPKEAHNVGLDDQTKACIDQVQQKADPNAEATVKKDEAELSFNTYLQRNEGKGESSTPLVSLPLAAPPNQRPIVCKFCGQQFATTQALGGHQNAHKKEREIQRAMKAAQEFGTNPFLYSLPGILSHPLPGTYGSYDGNRFRYHPYDGYAQRGFQARPSYPHSSLGPSRGPTGFGRSLEEFMGNSPMNPVAASSASGWRAPYPYSAGPIRRTNGPTNFNHAASPNLTAYLQAMENEARLAKNQQQMGSSSLNLSLKSTDSAMIGSLPKRDEFSKTEPPMTHNESKNQQMESSSLNLSLRSADSAMMGSLPKCDEFSKTEPPMKQNESTNLDLNLKL